MSILAISESTARPLEEQGPISHLPSEMLQKIFSYLDPLGQQRAARVSSQWQKDAVDQIRSEQTFYIYAIVQRILSKLDKSETSIIEACKSLLASNPLGSVKNIDQIKVRLRTFVLDVLPNILSLRDLRNFSTSSLKWPLKLLICSLVEDDRDLDDEDRANALTDIQEKTRKLDRVALIGFQSRGCLLDAERALKSIPDESLRSNRLMFLDKSGGLRRAIDKLCS